MGALVGLLLLLSPAFAKDGKKNAKDAITIAPHDLQFANLHIPHLDQGPVLADFLEMKLSPAFAGKMLKVEKFQQRNPHDGSPISEKTEFYLGYTDKNLYVVCVCFEAHPTQLRSHMVRRELINDDDQIGVVLDTFHDRKEGLFFFINPHGIQQDGVWVDGNHEPDVSYDMVWNSAAKVTNEGWVGWIEIPFRSLRFPPKDDQTWGIFLERDIRHNGEYSFYPHIGTNTQGFLTQETDVDGLKQVSAGRNMTFTPYTTIRAFRELDDRDPAHPHFHGKHIEPRVGLDSKIVLKDSLVLDATVNPDFSQVESDEPQVTVNQRFEVLFPEKRPFFLENSSFFTTPINLVFTRRIVDPEYGVRLTGKVGRWGLGTLFADDRSPGRSVASADPLSGNKAYYTVLRVTRDFGKDSSVGLIYTDRELHTAPVTTCTDTPCLAGFNRVGGMDARLRFSPKWSATLQLVGGATKFNDGTRQTGTSFNAFLERSSHNLEYNVMYQDTTPGFETDTGFFRRPDVRRLSQQGQRRFWREGKVLLWHGPSLFTVNHWDHKGTRLEWLANSNYRFVFARDTVFTVFASLGHERLRPVDFTSLTANQDYGHHHNGFFFHSNYFKQFNLGGEFTWGRDTNYDPAIGPPVLADSSTANFFVTVRPVSGLTIDNTYLLTRLRNPFTQLNMFNNHIIRSKWNYQFTKEFSLRVIGQYNSTLVNPALTSLQNAKNLNFDVLFTYLLHPGTAIYVGYNSNLQNLDPSLGLDPSGNILRTRNSYLNDGRQFFVKLSYRFQY